MQYYSPLLFFLIIISSRKGEEEVGMCVNTCGEMGERRALDTNATTYDLPSICTSGKKYNT